MKYVVTLTTPVSQSVEVEAEHEGYALADAYREWNRQILYGTACAKIEPKDES